MKRGELDKRIIDLLKSRGYQSEKEISDFLEPSMDALRDPMKLKGMKEAKERVERAIKNKEKIVVYGDYDCDGISACVILYRYFASRGVKVDVYIPDRFDDGYGLSFDMIDEVIKGSKPDLIITVDLGITAVKEVEKVKEAGIDIIVTDHHEPTEVVPDCTIVDPKLDGQDYGFNGLCGAGVALKLVEALSGREEAQKYFDICALATIGDIVPLVDENRLIAKRGIEMINEGNCLKSYKYMLGKLGLKKLSGTDVTFKLVPRINASGRMSQGKKVFDFLSSEDDKELKRLYEEINKDNEERLECISEGTKVLEKEVKDIDLSKDNIILLRGDFHQGVLGILASRICHDYNRPAIIFTLTEEGTLKGSGRSLDNVDLHSCMEKCSDLFIRFGGHKMAIGVELEEKNFEEFKKRIKKEISSTAKLSDFAIGEAYDIEIDEDDISEKFINELSALEPFGCKNEKPTLMLRATNLRVNQMKDASYRHFKILTKKGKSMVAFSADKHVDALRSSVKKDIIIELENNEFRGKVYPQAILKNVFVKDIFLKEDKEKEAIVSLVDRFLSEGASGKTSFYDISELSDLLTSLKGNGFGTIVVVDSKKVADRIKKMKSKFSGYTISHIPLKNKQNTILVSPRGLSKEDAVGYANIIFTRQIFSHEKEAFASDMTRVYVPKMRAKLDFSLDKSREANIYMYSVLKKIGEVVNANNIFEWAEKVKASEGGIDKIQLVFSTLSFAELGFLSIDFVDFSLKMAVNPPKRELSSSKFMNKLA